MAKKFLTKLDSLKYPISNEFGILRIYKIPFDEKVFENADKLMAVFPKAIKETNIK